MKILDDSKNILINSTNTNSRLVLGSILAKPDTLRIVVDGHEMVMYKTGKSGPVVLYF